MDAKTFQTVFDKISDFLPQGWKKMVFFAGYTSGSYSMKFYSENGDGKYMDCFQIPGISKGQLMKAFMDIDHVLSEQRKDLGSKAWTVFTMAADANGRMRTDFEYDDHSRDMVSYEKSWEEKYLV